MVSRGQLRDLRARLTEGRPAPLDVGPARARLRLVTDEDAEHEIAHIYIEREARRVARLPRGRHGQQPRCEACNRFMANPALPCRSCGYLPGRGYAG